MPDLLYHGSTVVVRNIDLSLGADRKDFGKGFYTTSAREQAVKFAALKARRINADKGFVSIFEYTPNPELNVKIFNRANIEWLEFVMENRSFGGRDKERYDIAQGPVANDAVGLVLNQLLIGTYGDPQSIQARETAIRLLETEHLYNQVFFGTQRSLACLRFRAEVEIAVDR
jgi:hypothetical protein